jgi:hypothetical protein
MLCLPIPVVKAGPIYDFDGDGRTDFVVQRSNGSGTSFTWLFSGAATDIQRKRGDMSFQ